MTGGGRDDGGRSRDDGGRQGRRREARTTGRGRDDGEFGDGGECGYDGERQGQKEKLEDGERRTRVSKRVAQEGDRGLHACLCCHLFTPPARLSPASFLRRQES